MDHDNDCLVPPCSHMRRATPRESPQVALISCPNVYDGTGIGQKAGVFSHIVTTNCWMAVLCLSNFDPLT